MNTRPKTCIPCPKIEDDAYDWYERHASRCELAAKKAYDVIFIGDSITHFWEGEKDQIQHGAEVWNEFYGQRNVLNLGFGFDRTQNVLWRLEHGEADGQHPKAIVLNIGTNQFSVTKNYPCDTPEDAAAGILEVIRKLADMFPNANMMVMALFPRGDRGSDYRTLIPRTNAIVKEKTETMPRVTFCDLSRQMTEPDGALKAGYYRDGTHLLPAGYRIWAEALEPWLKQCLETSRHNDIGL